MSRGVVQKKRDGTCCVCVYGKGKKTFTIERYLCVRRKGKKPCAHRAVFVYAAKEKKYSYTAVLVYTAKKNKLIGCLVGLGNLQGTRLLSNVTGRVGKTSIYIGASPSRGCGRLQPPLQ